MTIGIYSILNKETNKRYIGLSKNIEVRTYKHKWYLNNETHSNIHLQRAWIKYGEGSFVFEILEICFDYDPVIISNLEKEYILEFDTFKNGYNRSLGGDGMIGYVANPLTLKKLREANIGNSHALGRKASESERIKKSIAFYNRKDLVEHSERGRRTLKKIWEQEWFREQNFLLHLGNQYSKGISHSEDFKKHLSETRIGSGNPFYGKRHTDAAKKAISINSKEMWQNKDYRERTLSKRKETMQTNEYKEKISLATRGGNNGRSKMNEKDVLEIRLKKLNGEKLKEISEAYPNYTKRSIQKAYSGETWKYLPMELEEVRSMLINYQISSENTERFND